jgi:tRNA dimethylallyltransferase
MQNKPQVLFIVGQTAVGKSALALEAAMQYGGEIISADSRQVYRHMDIGTAKPTTAEQSLVQHHLIDVALPDAWYSLAMFRTDALAAIASCVERGVLPIVAGGTGQYLAALLEGWTVPELPPNEELRAQLEADAVRDGHEALHRRLAQLDPVAAASIHTTNVRRIVRALEVCIGSGTPFSSLTAKAELTFEPIVVWLQMPSEELYQRIDARVDVMVAHGLVAEVQALVTAGYGWELPAMSGIGYRELQPYLAGECSLAEAVQRIKFDTHAFARRQSTWFRRFTTIKHTTPCTIEQLSSVFHRPTARG